MQGKPVIFIFLILSIACSDSKKYPIESMSVDVNYYLTALSEVNQQLASNKSNVALYKRKLLVSRELRWPEDVSEDIAFLKREEGLNYELVQYAIDFYSTYHYYELLLNVLDEWESLNGSLNGSDRWRIVAYLGLGRYTEAKYMLWKYVQDNPKNIDALLFAADNYLDLEDSTRAVYAYGKVAEIKRDHSSLLDLYVPVLIQMGYSDRAESVLFSQELDSSNSAQRYLIADMYFKKGDYQKAHDLLKKDESESAIIKRINWFEETLEWDTAVSLVNQLVWRDSSQAALLRKATLLENRGWLNSSYNLYNLVLANDSTNSIALEGAQNVGRKIAYLRSLREQEEKIPVLDVSPKKGTENNE